jgi:hypothetical protein
MKKTTAALILSAFTAAACAQESAVIAKLYPEDYEIVITKYQVALGKKVGQMELVSVSPGYLMIESHDSTGPTRELISCDELNESRKTFESVAPQERQKMISEGLKDAPSLESMYVFSEKDGPFDREEGKTRARNVVAIMLDHSAVKINGYAKSFCPQP